MERAVAAGDAGAVDAAAHRLGGSASNVGAAPVARLCAALEETALVGGLPEPATCRALRREVALACRVLGVLALELAPGDARSR